MRADRVRAARVGAEGDVIRSPYPYFGGKFRAASLIWAALGDVPNFVSGFLGGAGAELARPHEPRIETWNDINGDVANFWRALGWPDQKIRHRRTMQVAEIVAAWADYPVSELDLHARHRWLVERLPAHRERMRRDPKYFSPERAGWWVWGLCQWIGSGWCVEPENGKRPDIGHHAGQGVHAKHTRAEPMNWFGRSGGHRAGRGVTSSRARDLSTASDWNKRPVLAQRGSRGVTGPVRGQLPDISGDGGAAGRGVHGSGKRGALVEWMFALYARTRYVRVCCGDFERVLGPSSTTAIGLTGVFLDPPYSAETGRDPSLYADEDLKVAHRAREWAIANGGNPKLRIVLCGYEGEHDMPSTWRCVPWKAVGGYAAAAGNTENAHRERLWLSPHCLSLEGEAQRSLFETEGVA